MSVLILGAGINGAAVARDLAINGIPVCIVDTGDVAGGATSRSSRLIHGGLRYLEYRDTDHVRESLRERERLLKLAPHFVRPLRLSIPVERQFGGLWSGLVKFSGLARTSLGRMLLSWCRSPRGLLAVRAGLSMYDRLAASGILPGHDVRACEAESACGASTDGPRISTERFHWLCSYSDAQLEFPERFVLAMFEDGRRAAAEQGCRFEILPRHRAVASKTSTAVMVESLTGTSCSTPEANLTTAAPNEPTRNAATHRSIEPTIIINATGAWGDRTLEAIGVHERQLFAGTKGSHLFTTYAPLIKALNGNGIYSEAHDGRLVFILPCAAGVLIGTTDDPYSGDPGEAVSTPADVDYLVQMVNEVFPGVALTADHVDMHHAGVRPLPTSDSSSAAAIPRGHSIEESTLNGIPVLTLVGGKLTTCRTLAEQVSKLVCRRLNHEHSRNTDDRLIPGADGIPADVALSEHHSHLATKHSLSLQQVETVWRLIGNRFDEVFPNTNSKSNAATTHDSITGTFIPREFVRWSIDYEWCTRLEDLVERRLMLTFVPQVRRDTLRDLGEQLINAQRLDRSQLESEVEQVCARLGRYYGKTIEPD